MSYRQKLINFYTHHAPEKLKTVDAMLQSYRGREENLFRMLEQKYTLSKKKLRKLPNFEDPEDGVYPSVLNGLKALYKKHVKPIEEMYLFHKFFHPLMKDSDFDAVPMIMLVGQYSTGKTSFIKYILQRDFPGIRIGPEPTTDRFVTVMCVVCLFVCFGMFSWWDLHSRRHRCLVCVCKSFFACAAY